MFNAQLFSVYFFIYLLYNKCQGLIHFVVSQNIDGLLHRAGFPLSRLAEVHGNVFVEKCPACRALYIRQKGVVPTMTLKPTGRQCECYRPGPKNLPCRGLLRDTVLDWEDELPEPEMSISLEHVKNSQLCICLGTSLQIFPVAGFPSITKKKGGQVAIVNLQKTRADNVADVRIHGSVDVVMRKLLTILNIEIPSTCETTAKISLESPSDNSSFVPLLDQKYIISDTFYFIIKCILSSFIVLSNNV